MVGVAALAFDRQARMIAVTDTARARALQAWKGIDFAALDQSWASVGPVVAQQVTAAQLTLANGSDRFTSQVSGAYNFAQDSAAINPSAFAGIDGQGRDIAGLLFGSVTTTKRAVGAGLGRVEALQAGGTYLAAVMKTIIADMARSADKVSAAGKGYTHYVRVVNGSACSRCAMLAGISSAPEAFKRHVSCQCGAVPVVEKGSSVPKGLHDSPDAYFASLSELEQDRVFTKAGAEAIREGADISKVVSARRGAKGIGYSSHSGTKQLGAPSGRFVKSTIGYRADGTAVQVYTTLEGTTVRGSFGRTQVVSGSRLSGARYSSTARVRLMPESIFTIAGNDTALRQAFLRDAGYLRYGLPTGADIIAQQRADRILVNRATLKYGNFTLG